MTHFSKSVREVRAMTFSTIEPYWNDAAFRAKIEAEQQHQRDLANSHIDAGMEAINEKQRQRWAAEETPAVVPGLFASAMPWATPRADGPCYDCRDTGTATVTLWGQPDGDRYAQEDVPCHCPLGQALEKKP